MLDLLRSVSETQKQIVKNTRTQNEQRIFGLVLFHRPTVAAPLSQHNKQKSQQWKDLLCMSASSSSSAAVPVSLNQRYEAIRLLAESESPTVLQYVDRNDLSAPYYFRTQEGLNYKRFNCYRGITYGLAFVVGILRWLRELVAICFGCRSTYNVMSDAEMARMFTQDWPFCGLLVPITPHERAPPPSSSMRTPDRVTMHHHHQRFDEQKEDVQDEEKKNEPFPFPFPAQFPLGRQMRVLSTEDIATFQEDAFPGTYVYPVRVEFSAPVHSDAWTIDAIEIEGQRMTSDADGDSDAWALAKLHALQAMHYFIVLEYHPFVHFTQDLFITTVEQLFPDPTHEVRQLIDPHSCYTFEINRNALESKHSVLNAHDSAFCCFDAHTVPRKGIKKLIRRGYERKMVDNVTQFGRVPDVRFQPYWDAIYQLCLEVSSSLLIRLHNIADVPSREAEFYRLFRWMHFLHEYELCPADFHLSALDPSPLALVLTDHIFTVSVRHSAEHHMMARSDQRAHPLAIYAPWSRDVQLGHLSTSRACCAWQCGCGQQSSGRIVPLCAWLRQLMYNDMFVEWWNNRVYADGRLHTTKYDFQSPALQTAAERFRARLESLPETFIAHNRVSRSIQW